MEILLDIYSQASPCIDGVSWRNSDEDESDAGFLKAPWRVAAIVDRSSVPHRRLTVRDWWRIKQELAAGIILLRRRGREAETPGRSSRRAWTTLLIGRGKTSRRPHSDELLAQTCLFHGLSHTNAV